MAVMKSLMLPNQVSISNIGEDMITLMILWRPFYNFAFKKNSPQGLETHIRRDITRML